MMDARLCGNSPQGISLLIIDSRMVFNPHESLFFALKGSSHNGHSFIAELYNSGVRNFVVSDTYIISENHTDANFYHVSNVLRALQGLAAAHRRRFSLPVLAITGSNGKTIVKEWLSQMIADTQRLVRSPRSYNSQAGVPLSVWQLNADASLAIFEAGISQTGEMEHLETIIRPTFGLFTNLGTAHQQHFASQEHKLREKLLLFKDAETIFYCKDHHLEDTMIRQMYANRKLITWGQSSDADLRITAIQHRNQTAITTMWNGSQYVWLLPFEDAASIEDALHALLFLLYRGYDAEYLSNRLTMLQPVGMRMEQKQGVGGALLINDSYNSDFTSLELALDFLNQQGRQKGMKRTLILSDILQSGIPDAELYPKVGALIKTNGINRLIGVGKVITSFADAFSGSNAQFFGNTDQLLAALPHLSFTREAVLIKGARTFEFERIVSLLETTRHSTVLEINLNALINNLNAFRSRFNTDTKMLAMVKAFGYGSGSHEIAGALQHHKVDYLGVAFADEGIDLRRAGIALPIIVMNPEESSFALMPQYNLEPEIYSFHTLHTFHNAMEREGASNILIHLKIDTGMNRLGFRDDDEIDHLAAELRQMQRLRVKSVFSHLAASDAPHHDSFTHQQIARFSQACERLSKAIGYTFWRHILNSAGIERFPEAHFDMVRLGIGLYGIGTAGIQLENVATLKTCVSQIKDVRPNESVGYGRTQRLTAGGAVAIIPIGYADGLNRRLSCDVGKALIHGRLAPIVGNICMDMCMIDISDIHNVKEGDEVIIFGDDYPVTNLAQQLDTIPYEILTGIGRRVKRVYFKE
jgi:alanine racemase